MAQTTPTVKARERVRAVDIGGTKAPATKLPDDVRKLAREYHIENAAKNKHNNAAEKARKSLLAKLQEHGFKEGTEHIFDTTNGDGEKIQLKVGWATPDASYISVEKLAELVDKKTLMKIVSATKGAVEENCPNNVLAACTVTVPGGGKTNSFVEVVK